MRNRNRGMVKLNEIIENSIEGIWVIDQNANTIYVNSNLAQLFGYDMEEMIGKSLFEFVEKKKIKLARIYFNRRKDGIKEEHKFQFKSKKGILFNASIYTSPIFDERNQFSGTITFFLDIEEIKDEKIYIKSKRTLSTLLSNLIGVAFRCKNDKNWTMEFLSKRIYDLTEYNPEELLFNNKIAFRDIILEDDRERIWTEVQSALAKNLSFKISYRVRTASGNIKWVVEQGRGVFLKKSQLVIEGYIYDISREKEMEHQLKESERKYREAFYQAEFYKDLFTHDMNNILQILYSSLQLRKEIFEKSNDNEILDELFEIIESQVLRAKRLIHNIKLMSKIGNGDKFLEKIEIISILTNIKNHLIGSMRDKDININIFNEKSEYFILANNLIEDIFGNLLINSIIHNRNEKIIIDIKIFEKIKGLQKYIEVDFTDNGIGIEYSRRKKIFERDFRNIESIQGIGLGLSLVKKLLDYFNGEIHIEDNVSGNYKKGTKCIVLLPEVE